MLHFIAVFICKDNQRILSPRDKDFLNDTGAISDGLKTTDRFVQAIAMSLGPSNTSVLQCYENKDKHKCPPILIDSLSWHNHPGKLIQVTTAQALADSQFEKNLTILDLGMCLEMDISC